MKITTGYYQGGGQLWDYGEVPECDICGSSADDGGLRATNTSGVNICFKDKCAVKHCDNQFEEIELVDDGNAFCEDCSEPYKAVVKVSDGSICEDCLSTYEEVDA